MELPRIKFPRGAWLVVSSLNKHCHIGGGDNDKHDDAEYQRCKIT